MYHNDPLREAAGSLVFRDYGRDIVERLLAGGFAHAWIEMPAAGEVPWGYGSEVICAVHA
jgi:hypothetical protein